MAKSIKCNPLPNKKPAHGKWLCEQDADDFEQELSIQKWLESQDEAPEFDFKHISSKGTARNTLVRASFSLDQKITEDSSGTFADLIAGSDGRDLFSGNEPTLEDILDAHFVFLGFDEELSEWLIKKLKSSQPNDKLLLERFLTDSEWLEQ